MNHFSKALVYILTTAFLCTGFYRLTAQTSPEYITVPQTADFEITGDGSNAAWNKASWSSLVPNKPDRRVSRLKILYSTTGLYFLYDNEDPQITATKNTDFDKLWQEDVNEVFLWPDTTQTIYLEYEISPLNHELVLLVPNINGKNLGWRPWLYAENRRTRHLTTIVQENGSGGRKTKKWYAEFFIPYELLTPLGNLPPHSGSVWRANMYRVDYDHSQTIEWSWKQTVKSFHEYQRFGRLLFE